MPLAGAIARIAFGAALTLVASCAAMDAPEDPSVARMPFEVRAGQADMMIMAVEQGVSRAEVAGAVQALADDATLCMSWPGLWIDALERRTSYTARYDLMSRDWGESVAANSRRRMQEFVDLGFITQRDRPDIGVGVTEYTLTTEGTATLQGSIEVGGRLAFCPETPRRVIEIVDMQWGAFECGSLAVRFTHTADDWPAWAQTEAARARIVQTWAANGDAASGTVTLGRQWFSRRAAPAGLRQNGGLTSACYDPERGRVMGTDLNLAAGSP